MAELLLLFCFIILITKRAPPISNYIVVCLFYTIIQTFSKYSTYEPQISIGANRTVSKSTTVYRMHTIILTVYNITGVNAEADNPSAKYNYRKAASGLSTHTTGGHDSLSRVTGLRR